MNIKVKELVEWVASQFCSGCDKNYEYSPCSAKRNHGKAIQCNYSLDNAKQILSHLDLALYNCNGKYGYSYLSVISLAEALKEEK